MSESYEQSSGWGESPTESSSNNNKYSNLHRENRQETSSENLIDNQSSYQKYQQPHQESKLSSHIENSLTQDPVLFAKSFFKDVESYLITYSSQHGLHSNEQSKMVELFRSLLVNNEQYLLDNPNNEFLVVSLSLHLRSYPEKQEEPYCKHLIDALYEKINAESKFNPQLKYW